MDWLKNITVLWIVIAILLISFVTAGAYWYSRPDLSKVQEEAKTWKAKYELVVKNYEASKKTYNAKLASIQVQYNKLKLDYDKVKKEYQSVQKPKTSKERTSRLTALGYPPIIQ